MTRQAVGAIHESPADTLVANSQNLQHIAIAIRRLYRTHSVYRACLASISPFVSASYFADSPGYRTPLGVSATIGSTPQSGAGTPSPTGCNATVRRGELRSPAVSPCRAVPWCRRSPCRGRRPRRPAVSQS